MRILLLGDTHGDARWWKVACAKALQLECTVIMQLGDFGYWEHRPAGKVFLDAVSGHLRSAGLTAFWLDGNHENHTMLRARYPAGQDGFVPVRPNLSYCPRGLRWTWDDVNFLALGGAYSIDRDSRLHAEILERAPHSLWWPEELITAEEAERAKAGGHADVMLTHDCPDGVDVLGSHHSHDYLIFPESQGNREMLRDVVDVVGPALLAHGHYHKRHSAVLELAGGHRVRVEGFANEGTHDDSWGVLDTAELKARVLR